MSCCNCGQPNKLCRCPNKSAWTPERAYIAECTDCDPCRPCESMVKICSFVAPTLTEGQRFRNSFVYNQEDDSVYYIADDGTPTRFGSSPMFINAFNPDDRKIPRQTVFDFANQKAYIYDPEGNYITVNLSKEEKKLHIYCPVDNSELTYPSSISGRVEIYWDKESSDIKDASGNTLSPADLISLGDKLIDYTVVVHIPESYNAEKDLIIPEQTFVLSPTMGAPLVKTPHGQTDDGYTLSGVEFESELWFVTAKSTGIKALIFAEAYKGAV